ncbi:DUF4230 domain-containing protein [Glacieibacterium sp.]|uniref:DUF4230 domain-containing protein n=1 Tax=Glacieibacterium sp. TaxID=2860237 RepID=UPI003B00208F
MRWRAILLGLLAGLVVGGLIVALFATQVAGLLGRGPDPVTIADASLRSVQAQNRLTAFVARFTVAVTSEQTRLGIFKAKKTLIVPGTIRYELDWNKLTARDLVWDKASRTLTVTIPQPVIAGPEIDLTRIREFKDGALLFALTDAEAAFDTANSARAKQELLDEAKAPILMHMASTATINAVQRTFSLPFAAAGVDAKVVVRVAG